jgi:hypothetical protein
LKLAIETPLMRNKVYTLYHVNLYGSLIKKIHCTYKNNPELTITINGLNILMSLVGIQSTADGKKIWKIKLKIGKRITKHMRVCWKHSVDEDFVPLVCWFDGLDALFTCFCLIVSRLGMPHSNKCATLKQLPLRRSITWGSI